MAHALRGLRYAYHAACQVELPSFSTDAVTEGAEPAVRGHLLQEVTASEASSAVTIAVIIGHQVTGFAHHLYLLLLGSLVNFIVARRAAGRAENCLPLHS